MLSELHIAVERVAAINRNPPTTPHDKTVDDAAQQLHAALVNSLLARGLGVVSHGRADIWARALPSLANDVGLAFTDEPQYMPGLMALIDAAVAVERCAA